MNHGDMQKTPADDNMNMNMSSMYMPMMHMNFYWGKDAIILFSGWPKDSLGMYLLAFFFVLLLAVVIEVLSASAKAKLGGNNPVVAAFAQASIHAVRMGLAYMVMLAVMSFNLGIFIAAVAGHGIGIFIVKSGALAINNRHDAAIPKV